PLVLEDLRERRPDRGLVVDDQNAGHAGLRVVESSSRRAMKEPKPVSTTRRLDDSKTLCGQFNLKPGPPRLVVMHMNPSVVVADDAVDDGEAEAGAAAFGGKVGEEQF